MHRFRSHTDHNTTLNIRTKTATSRSSSYLKDYKSHNLRLDFMKKHRRGTYTTLLTEGRLNEYLHAIDIQAHKLLDDIIPPLAQERGIDEDLKTHNALGWTAEMNNIKASAEEMVLSKIVFV